MDRKMSKGNSGSSSNNPNRGSTDSGRVKIDKKGTVTHTLSDFKQKIKTYVTHNKGKDWQLIRAPK
jgi:hypothetical protein